MSGARRWWRLMGGVGVLVALAAPSWLSAQRPGDAARPGRRAPLPMRLQQRLDTLVRVRLQLTDEQFAQLQAVATRLEEGRLALREEEVTTRLRLRRALASSERVDQAAVAQLLDEIPRLERRKVELLEQEQRELAQFLSPSQRARYLAIQEEMRRGMLEVQRRRLGRGGGLGGGDWRVRSPIN